MGFFPPHHGSPQKEPRRGPVPPSGPLLYVEEFVDRMPVMLMMEDYDRWLGATSDLDELRAMLRPYDANLMEAYAVSRAVNSVKNDTEECIEPVNEAVSTAK